MGVVLRAALYPDLLLRCFHFCACHFLYSTHERWMELPVAVAIRDKPTPRPRFNATAKRNRRVRSGNLPAIYRANRRHPTEWRCSASIGFDRPRWIEVWKMGKYPATKRHVRALRLQLYRFSRWPKLRPRRLGKGMAC